jgi:small subunit ribosomal protein S20
MPITDSAKKALRQSIRRRARNLKRANDYKWAVKDLKKVATDKKEAPKLLAKAYKAIDKAAKTGVIKKNKAARLKSGVAKLIAK